VSWASGKLDQIGSPASLAELPGSVPSAENLAVTYKLLGAADENSATDITALLNMVESLAMHTGAAIALAGHFAKGNASGKEAIDRISGSGVFARDHDSLVVFTKHEQEGAFVMDLVLRNGFSS